MEKTSGILRIVAGGYLLYSAYNLFQAVRTGESGNPTLMIAFSILFVIVGGVILFTGIKGMKQQGLFGESEDSEGEEDSEGGDMIEDGENHMETDKNAEESENAEKLIAAEDTETAEE